MARMRSTVALLGLAAALNLVLARPGTAQEPRLEGRVPEPTRSQIDAILDSATALGLPTEPLVDRALEGAAKGADPDRILAAVRRLSGELRLAYEAFGPRSSAAEIVSGASAIRAGARPEDLAHLRELRADQPLTVATATLADLVAVGVPADTAVAAVMTLAEEADDAQYIAFRRNVERDIALGASPVAALGVRLEATAADVYRASGARSDSPPRPRKP
jgi:hypothetical protein